jgi:hypothetical protein
LAFWATFSRALVQVVSDEHDVGALSGYIRSCTHCNTDTRLTQRWSVIDAIAHHSYRSIFLYLPGNQCTFVFREKVGTKLDDAELVGHIFGYCLMIIGHMVGELYGHPNQCRSSWDLA